MKNSELISRNLIHDSGKKHVSGFAEYTDDITEPLNILYGAIGWSKKAHAKIKKNIILKANIAYGGMSEIPKRAPIIEKALTNSVFSEDTFSRAKNLINKDFSPIDDMRASKNYRINVAKNLMMKFFYEVSEKQNLRVNS